MVAKQSTTSNAYFHLKQVSGNNYYFSYLKFALSACITTAGDKCKFPFKYSNGITYTKCTKTDMSGDKSWCSTETDKFGNHIKGKFGYCIDEVCKGINYIKMVPSYLYV